MRYYRYCKWCGDYFETDNYRQRYCSIDHSVAAMQEAQKQMKAKEGAIYEKWKEGLRKAISQD